MIAKLIAIAPPGRRCQARSDASLRDSLRLMRMNQQDARARGFQNDKIVLLSFMHVVATLRTRGGQRLNETQMAKAAERRVSVMPRHGWRLIFKIANRLFFK